MVNDLTPNQGITSTCVENTVIEMGDDLSGKDHLHIRGEYSSSAVHVIAEAGSPPHTWRIQARECLSSLQTGITSTYVENTSSRVHIKYSTRDHLHIRGEYSAVFRSILMY